MRVCYLVETYTQNLGYIDNILPFSLKRAGHEVCLVTCALPVYFHAKEALLEQDVYSRRESYSDRGVRIEVLPFGMIAGRVYMRGLADVIAKFAPDVVIVRGMASPVLAQAVVYKSRFKYRLFVSTGQAYSSMRHLTGSDLRAWWLKVKHYATRYMPGYFLGKFVDSYVASTEDCGKCAVDYYGAVEEKISVIPLGVDISIFHPVKDSVERDERMRIRRGFGVEDDALLCIWTGRMTISKCLPVLSRAVQELRAEGYAIYALFIGSGSESSELKKYKSNIVLDALPWHELAKYYRAADISVWPFGVTTSMLDASACGLPIVMSDRELATERWVGIGSTFAEGSIESLKQAILRYMDSQARIVHSEAAALSIRERYDWDVITKKFSERLEGR